MGTHPIFESDFDCLTEKIGNEALEFDPVERGHCVGPGKY